VQGFTAFTVKGDGLLRELKTTAHVRAAQSVFSAPDGKYAQEEVRALWDTGATACALSPSVIARLNLAPIGKTPVSAAGSKYDSGVFLIDVLLPNGLVVSDIRAVEAKSIEGFDMLIGMDIITLGDSAITNCGKKTIFSFRFPSGEKPIDYCEQVHQVKAEHQKTENQNYRNRIGKLKKRHR
jgi:hypothetical protein